MEEKTVLEELLCGHVDNMPNSKIREVPLA